MSPMQHSQLDVLSLRCWNSSVRTKRTWVFATRTKTSKPVPLKSATLADCCVGFLLAKVVYFYWPTDGFSYFKCWQSFIFEGKEGERSREKCLALFI